MANQSSCVPVTFYVGFSSDPPDIYMFEVSDL